MLIGRRQCCGNYAAALNISGGLARGHDQARGQSALADLLAGTRRGLDDLEAAQSSRRPIDRYPIGYGGHTDSHERTRRHHRQGIGERPLGETAFSLRAAKKGLATAVKFANSIHAQLPVAASALACFEEAEAAGLADADATTRWPQRQSR
jgi:hypothetical protein